MRTTSSFAEAMHRVIDLGGDTDTVAAVTGGLLGTVYGIAGVPMRWASVVNGTLPGFGDRVWTLPDLHLLAARLDGGKAQPYVPDPTLRNGPVEVVPGIWAADLDAARDSDRDFAVISLCRTGGHFPHDVQRFAYLVDDDSNSEVDVVLDDVLGDIEALRAEGRRVLVHCFGGASRTGLVLRGWLRRTEGSSVDEATAQVAAAWPRLGLWNDSFTSALHRMRPRS